MFTAVEVLYLATECLMEEDRESAGTEVLLRALELSDTPELENLAMGFRKLFPRFQQTRNSNE
jgi:hypothetical protein